MRVEVSGLSLVFPATCACCGADSNTTLIVSATRSTGKSAVPTQTNTWEVPYCSACARHESAARRAVYAATAVGILALGGAFALFITGAACSGCVVAMCGVGAVVALYRLMMSEAQKLCRGTCVSARAAIRFLYWHGTHHAFEIASQPYAVAFMIANTNKLVNVSAEANDALAASGHGHLIGAPQRARRRLH